MLLCVSGARAAFSHTTQFLAIDDARFVAYILKEADSAITLTSSPDFDFTRTKNANGGTDFYRRLFLFAPCLVYAAS